MTTLLTLDDIASRDPDWDLVRVYSDFLEDQERLKEAQAVRCLYEFFHWPLDSWDAPGEFRWWIELRPRQCLLKDSIKDPRGKWFKDNSDARLYAASLPEVKDWPQFIHHYSFKTVKDALAWFLYVYFPVSLYAPSTERSPACLSAKDGSSKQ